MQAIINNVISEILFMVKLVFLVRGMCQDYWCKLDFFKNNKKNGKAVNLSDKKCKSSRFDISGS